MREITLDTETTGLDPAHGHRIVEIGCVELYNRLPTGNSYHIYLNPERDMPPEAEAVHGLSSGFLQDKPLFANIAQDFLAFIAEDPLVIHNASFDMKFINYELKRIGHEGIPMQRTIDTVQMARRTFPGSPASLDALCKRFSIDLSGREKHGALLDAELLAGVYLELTGGRQTSLDLGSTSNADFNADSEGAKASYSVNFPRRHFPPSAEELNAHSRFIETHLKTPLWKN